MPDAKPAPQRSRRSSVFRPSDVQRAIKGFVAAGQELGRVEIHAHGCIVIFPANGSTPDARTNSWDDVLP